MKKFIKENWFRISIIIILLIISLSYLLNQFEVYKNNENNNAKTEKLELPNCDFEIVKGETYKDFFDNSKNIFNPDHPIKFDDSYCITYTGTIKNKSKERQYLETMILKMYQKNDVYIDDTYDNIKDWIEPNKLFSYKLRLCSTKIDIRDEFSTKVDIYPWFSTCK